MKKIAQAFWDLPAKSMTLCSSFASPFAQPATSFAIRQRANNTEDEPAHAAQHRRKKDDHWLEHRGYNDSFAHDDEIKPDPKEDVLIVDSDLN